MLLIILFILNSAVALAQAQSKAVMPLGRSWLGLLGELESKGINKVGSLDLGNLRKQAQAIQWSSVSRNDAPPAFADGRRSAFFNSQKKQIFVSSEVTEKNPEMLSQLELHEVFGALKYNDRNYNLSTSLNLLNQIQDPQVRAELLKSYEKNLFQDTRRFSSGSGTSVGGGGDVLALVIKNRVLHEILNEGRQVSMDFLLSYPEIAFEPFYESDQQFVALRYEGWRKKFGTPPIPGVRIGKDGLQELIAFHFPAIDWAKKPWRRDAIVAEIKDKITQLFPAYLDSVMVRYTPQWCSERRQFSFAQTRDSRMAFVQEIRAAIRNSCDGFSIVEQRIPSFRDAQGNTSSVREWPRQFLRQRKYSCEFSAGGYVKQEELVLDRANPGREVRAITFTGETSAITDYSLLSLLIDSDKEANIIGLGIVNSHRSQSHIKVSHYKKLSATESKTIEINSLYAGPVRYSCRER